MALLLASPASAQDAPACPPGTRLFEHVLLIDPVCVPEAPERVAFIDDNVMSALELDIPSVTRSYYSDVIIADFPGAAARLDPSTTTHIGNTWEMHGEVLLTAQPDLVVTGKYWDVAIPYAQDLAPTLVIDDERATSWRDVPRMLAALFGKEAEQGALEAGIDARMAAFKAALEAAGGGGTSFTFTQIESETSFWTFTTEAFGTQLAIDAGLQLGPHIPSPEQAAALPDGSTVAVPVSQENLDFIDADHLFFYANLGSDPEKLVEGNELFQRFAAARPGRIHFIKGEYWFRAGAMSAHRIIDDLYRAVLGSDAAAVSPNPLAWAYQAPAS
jgi:ABC-type Fe3+-hydroxamate transport system substrate-binding protein